MQQTVKITITQTTVAEEEFQLHEIEAAAGITLDEAGSLEALVNALRDAGTLTDRIERTSECTDSDWVGAFAGVGE